MVQNEYDTFLFQVPLDLEFDGRILMKERTSSLAFFTCPAIDTSITELLRFAPSAGKKASDCLPGKRLNRTPVSVQAKDAALRDL